MIQTQDYVKTYATGNNVTLWGITFPFYSFDDINLYVITDGVKTQIEPTYFEILPNEDSETIATIKYNVHYPKVGDPLPSGSTIMIERITPITQTEDSSQVYFNSKDVERMVDKVTMIAQENRGLATDETAGLIQIATQDEVNAGVNTTKAVTPATLQNKLTPLLNGKQNKLTAGAGITITGDTISSTSSSVAWGNIIGTLADQTDLNTALSAKQSTANLATSISSSSTDTQYPSAKCVYDIVGDIETALQTIRGVQE